MYPKFIYIFCHWLWVASLGIILLLLVFTLLVLVPFSKLFSYEFICWICDFYKWCLPSVWAGFIVGTGVCVRYAGEEIHKQRIENEKREREQKYEK